MTKDTSETKEKNQGKERDVEMEKKDEKMSPQEETE